MAACSVRQPGPRRGPKSAGEPYSPRERYLAAFSHQEADRVPIDLATSGNFRFPGEPWQITPLERVNSVREIGGDPCLDIWLPEPAFHPDVSVRTGVRKDSRAQTLYTEYDTPCGTLTQVVRQTADWSNVRDHQLMQPTNLGNGLRHDWKVHLFDDWNAPRYESAPINTAQDVDKLAYLLRIPNGPALEKWREEARIVKQWAAREGLLLRARRTFGAEAGMWLMRFEDFLLATLERSDLIANLLEVVSDWQVKRAELALDLGVDVLMHRGYYETPDYFSPTSYRRYCQPLIDRLGSMSRQTGTRFALQRSEGNTKQIELLRGMPIDILYDVDPGMGGEDLRRLTDELGDQMTLWGGIDSTLVVNRGSWDDIDHAIHEAMRLCAPGGGFVIMPLAWTEPNIPFEKVQRTVAACVQYG